MAIQNVPAVPAKTARTAYAAAVALFIGLSLAGCATQQPTEVAAVPDRGATPIDPSDPLGRWVPHIREASERFDVPERWIRAVMMRESHGRHMVNGRVLTSKAGAIGLMQVMPGTYELMRAQYGLGSDPTDVRDNIMAGTAYIREMYDLFGAPGFLAAYNCGPACYANVLARKQKLPGETRSYLAALTPQIRGHEPQQPSASSGAVAIEVAVLPKDAPKPAPAAPAAVPAPAQPEVVVAQKPAAPVQVAPVQIAKAPPRSDKPAPAPAPVQVAKAEPKPQMQLAKAGKPQGPAPATRLEVAEALLPAGVDRDRVQIRFISQRSDGCGSLKGKDSVCVSLERF
ncbi:transglycosylase SLT domain-containing protein [Azospirillum sp.]|uniref:transglycosylase SLT domain-containing protein n=1 Tax=Azospirillum sp. TaxID=34012 RepID=UPI002D26BBEC|nr:transglycosylase SLT domain-containing protein [Azospirillum sp.]HYD64907.1 transglycosylase SLT domain-containing protein [Azospirillum sp.]